jgi:hypothetical protein
MVPGLSTAVIGRKYFQNQFLAGFRILQRSLLLAAGFINFSS